MTSYRRETNSAATWPDLGDLCFQGEIFQIYRRSISLPSGHSFVQECAAVADIVRVYPIVNMSELIMIREYRHEVGRVVVRTVSGTIEEGETAVQAAVRELKEELGFVANNSKEFAVSIPMLKVSQRIHHFVVRDPIQREQDLDAGESIVPWPVRLDELDALASSGTIIEDSVIAGLVRLRSHIYGTKWRQSS